MKCPNCKSEMERINVSVEGADHQVVSYQCENCGYIAFDQESANLAIMELKLKETPLKIRQKIVKLSKDRLGTYFNSNVIRSLGLKSGEEIYVSVPDKKHIIISLKDEG